MVARQVALLAVALACALVLLVASAAVSARFQLASEMSRAHVCADEKLQENIRGLMMGALDSALHDHVAHTFEVWMKDETSQPARAKRGVDQGIAAYIRSRDAVMKWKLPTCP